MKMLIVGGSFNNDHKRGGRPSGVVRQLAALFSEAPGVQLDVQNGGLAWNLKKATGYELVLWLPDVHNNERKAYPEKDRGATLICSKVMRESYTRIDSVSRIFKMHGNAVIEVYPGKTKHKFCLVDALGNEWVSKTSDLEDLAEGIRLLHYWTQNAERVPSIRERLPPDQDKPTFSSQRDAHVFVALNQAVAKIVRSGEVGRFFGNASTRCMSLFPSHRDATSVLVSTRNVDKEGLTVEDFVPAYEGTDEAVHYYGYKPSVDTPIQLRIYRERPGINWMIHGHALVVPEEGCCDFVRAIPVTRTYYPCGDLREAEVLLQVIPEDATRGAVNIRNHGFLLYADTLPGLLEVIMGVGFRKLSGRIG